MGAIAVAHPSANAVGPVRLSCHDDGLRVDLLRVGRFASGFAFAGLADARSFRVPYRAIRAMLRDGDLLHLSLDPHAAFPYNRFALARFSRDPLSALLRAYRARALAVWASYLLPLPLAALALSLAPAELAGGRLGQGAIALVAAFASYRLLRLMVSWLTGGGPSSARLRDAFEHRVSVRLGLVPSEELEGGPLGVPRRRPALGAAFAGLGVSFRPRLFAIVGGLGVAAALVSVHVVQRFGVQAVIALPVDDARVGLAPALRAAASAAYVVGTPRHDACACDRVESLLWKNGMPQLGIMLAPIEGEIDAVWLELGETHVVSFGGEPGVPAPGRKPRIEFDLAVVNNSQSDLDTVDLVVTFARRDERGERRALMERGLHWPATLSPGEAVKWRVEGSGRTELKVDSRHQGRLGRDGVLAAPADTFAALESARLPVVRLHGAMMLSYLRDPRAEAYARGLGDLTPSMERARAQIIESLVPLQVCDAATVADGISLCVFNGTDTLHRGLVLSEIGSAKKKRHELRDLFLPGHGLRFTVDAVVARRVPAFRVDPLP